jgi:alpha-1,3-rhamnosyl/mannosyltransferase
LTDAILPLLNPGEELIAFNGLSFRPIDLASINRAESQNASMSDDCHDGSLARIKYQAFLSLRRTAPARFAFRYLKEKAFQANEQKFDVFHAVQMIPPGRTSKPVLPVIHDLSHIRFPDAHPPERVRWLLKRLTPAIDGVPFIQTVSQFSKREIVDLLGVPQARIHVAYPGISPWMSAARSTEDQSVDLAKYGVTSRRYFLMVSTREPRKNSKTSTDAYASLPDDIKRAFPLLWIGHRGWGDLDLSPAVERAIEQGQILIPGYVPDSDIAGLYRHTILFMMSSVYEGFGMPVTEALACGAPVAISDIPVFHEIAGKFARYVDALDVDGWRAAMLEAIDGEPTRFQPEALVAWLSQYSWSGNAKRTLELYRRLANQNY